ncbi:MAG: putative sialic acid transporter [Fimbriimonadaceae bacterium]|nr:putative sialic acid transporter [Fimbriimonadaceae bacterium]
MRAGKLPSSTAKTLAILVAALGYFVDVFDIWLYSSVRKQSLLSLGVPEADLMRVGENLLNWQMAGFIIGAIIFGVIADRKGRLTVLFASIITYSLANLANGFVDSISAYAVCRLVAGVGLAGELGAGIALVSELVSTAKRGWATTFVATVGVTGSVAAPLVAKAVDWRVAYFIGGGMGLALLVMRIGVYESGMFEQVKERTDIRKGDFWGIFKTRDRLTRYLAIILAGLPVWFFAGQMMTFSPEIQKALNIPDPKAAPDIIAIAALGLCIGDLIFGGISQILRSRKRAFYVAFLWITIAVGSIFLSTRTADGFFWMMFIGGVGAGYWAVFVTTSGEIFGTNLRGTVAITAPSFVRGMVIPMTMVRRLLEPSLGAVGSVAAIGGIVIVLAFFAVAMLPETFHRDMDFVETD